MAVVSVSAATITSSIQGMRAARVAVASDAGAIMGRDGRWHAPHNGFTWLDGCVYNGGEYLPEEDGASSNTRQIKFTVNATEAVKASLKTIGCSFGAAFERDGKAVCYAYFEGSIAETSHIRALVKPDRRVLSFAEQADGTTWETTMLKLRSKIGFEDFDDALLAAVSEWAAARDANPKTKTVKVSVGYKYVTYLVE